MSDGTEDDSSPELGEEERKLKEEPEKPIPGEGISDNELEVLPSIEEEEREEILLTATKPIKKPSKAREQKIQEKTIPLTGTGASRK